ncbi:MAG: hypothetical protein JW934_18795, partial [Anaerolineae bacterium]|nr:hypothetical protein [Anaerolineae bacterium]
AGVNGGVKQIELDGVILSGNEIPLKSDGGQHQVNVLLGAEENVYASLTDGNRTIDGVVHIWGLQE